MRVRIGTYWLAGHPEKEERDHSQVGNFAITPGRLQQDADGLRWEHSVALDRKNARIAVDFTTTRHFASYLDVANFEFGYPTAHPWTGTVVFRLDLADGTFVEWGLTDARITPPQLLPMGVSLTLQYSITGKAFTEGVSGSYTALGDEEGGLILDEGGEAITEET